MPATDTRMWEYSVRDRAGKLVTGKLEAPTEAQLVQRLKGMGYAPIKISETGSGMTREIKLPGNDNVTVKDLAVMSRQFAIMINSGLSMLRCLIILSEQTDNKALAKVLTALRTDVEGGASLSSSMAKHPRVFPTIMINMCRAGEVGGFLDEVLTQVADSMEAEVKLRGKIKSAMTYPIAAFGIAMLAVVGMLIFIVPVFSNMFTSLGGTLPLPTRILVFLSHGLRSWGLIVFALLGVLFFSRKRIMRNERVTDFTDPLKLKMPVFGQLVRKVAISRFSRNLGTMLASGVPILQSLEIVGQTAGNKVILKAVEDVEESVRRGESMAAPLARHPVFPPMVVQMLAVGEETGAVDTMLQKVADFYDQEVEATTDALTSLIEPLMIAFLGGTVGSIIVALYMPIFSVFNLIQ